MAEYMICSTPRGTGRYVAQTIPRDYKCIEYIGTMQKDYFGKITATCPRLFPDGRSGEAVSKSIL